MENPTALHAWSDITPLARNEFICWVEDAKQATTRDRRIRRTREELEEGQRRPCCWPGCAHREAHREMGAVALVLVIVGLGCHQPMPSSQHVSSACTSSRRGAAATRAWLVEDSGQHEYRLQVS